MAKKIIKSNEHESVSVLSAVQEYLTTIKQLSLSTQKEYRDELLVFASWCGSQAIMLSDIDYKVTDSFVEHLHTTHKPQKAGHTQLSTYTLAGYVRVILVFLNWCVGQKEYQQQLSADAVRKIKKPQIIEVIIETFTAEQIQALFKACDKEESEHLQVRDKAILAVLLDTGVRANELVTLTIGNVHLDVKDAYIKVLGKGGKWGEIGLGNQSRHALGKYIRVFRIATIAYEVKQQHAAMPDRQLKQITQQVTQHSLAFVNRYGEPMTVSGLYQVITRLGDWAHIEGVRCSPHTFRHTYAKLFMQDSGDIYQLSKLLRHSSISTTENYLKSLKQSEARKGAKSVLDNL